MRKLDDIAISQLITETYTTKLVNSLRSDVLIVGAGPAGLTAGYLLANAGRKVTLIEQRLTLGGGTWGGGMAMNEVVIQEEAMGIINDFDFRSIAHGDGMYTVDSVEFGAGLVFKAIQAGVTMLNLTQFEDSYLLDNRVCGVVVNRTMISGVLHVDPITLGAKAVIDGTGHDSVVVQSLRKRKLLTGDYGEGPMDATNAEEFCIEKTNEIFPGLWVSGMSVCAAYQGPRMGPIFGGMLLSGKKVAEAIDASIG